MAMRSRENLYNGVNAHLHRLMQSKCTDKPSWRGFHSDMITHLVGYLNSVLPENYQAATEQSLQIVRHEVSGTRVPDVTVYQTQKPSRSHEQVLETVAETWTATIETTIPPLEDVFAAVIYYRHDDELSTSMGVPVTRIEVLSPANKVGGSYYRAYVLNRHEALESGLPLVEIDYLHETTSPILGMPSYPEDETSYPYSITVSDPRRRQDEKQVRSFGFRVDDPIPTLLIPLTDEETISVDFGAVYDETFEKGRRGNQVDYALPPENLDSYAPIDQQRIIARMHAVSGLVQQSDDQS
jgi:hypothetical protein